MRCNMSITRYPVLVRRNKVNRIIERAIVVDLKINLMDWMTQNELASLLMDGTIGARALKSALTRVVKENNITGFTPKDVHTWNVRNFDVSDKWIEVAVKNKKCCKTEYILPSLVGFAFFAALVLGEGLNYFVNEDNDIPEPEAIAAMVTDVLQNLSQFILSNLVQNTAHISNMIFNKTIPSRGYSLNEDFIVKPKRCLNIESKCTGAAAVTYSGLLFYNTYINAKQGSSIMQKQYDDAYKKGLIPLLSYELFMALAMGSFWGDTGLDLLVQLSTAVTISDAIIKFFSSMIKTNKDEDDIEITEEKKANETVTVTVEEVKEAKEAKEATPPVTIPAEKKRGCFSKLFKRLNPASAEPLLGTVTEAELKSHSKRSYCLIM